jgi:TonB family protein
MIELCWRCWMNICPHCERSFSAGFRFCPADGVRLEWFDLRAHLRRSRHLGPLLRIDPLPVRLGRELSEAAMDFRHNPRRFLASMIGGERSSPRRRHRLQSGLALGVITYAGLTAFLLLAALGRTEKSDGGSAESAREHASGPLIIPLIGTKSSPSGAKTGGRTGGSLTRPARAGGGGGGGAREQSPASSGGAPLASLQPQIIPPAPLPIPHPVLIYPLIYPMTILADPRAIAPATRSIGDPFSNGEIISRGPGEGDGMGAGRRGGLGPGFGPGFGPGRDGNAGGRHFAIGSGPARGIGQDGDGGDVPWADARLRPRIIYKEKARYTEEARQNKIQGTVVLSATFSASGRLTDIRVLRGLPDGLTEKAIEAAQRIRFEPARRDGTAVNVRATLEYHFTLY